MKIRSFFSAVTACIAAFCGSGDNQPPQQYVNRPMFRPAPKRVKPRKPVADGRFHSNQRQRRKDARRANAAGVRNAFAR